MDDLVLAGQVRTLPRSLNKHWRLMEGKSLAVLLFLTIIIRLTDALVCLLLHYLSVLLTRTPVYLFQRIVVNGGIVWYVWSSCCDAGSISVRESNPIH